MTDTVAAIRHFNRVWTPLFGLLDKRYLGTRHTLLESRILFELGQDSPLERLTLRERLDIDDSYLSRTLSKLATEKLVRIGHSEADGRRKTVTLTATGRRAYEELDKRSAEVTAERLVALSEGQRRSVGEALTVVPRLLSEDTGSRGEVQLRSPRPGDYGWVVQRHGEIYADEYDWSMEFEALVAKIVVDYSASTNPARECAWIAEVDGARAGCIFCCRDSDEVARLRILLVEPWARGLGIGRRLVDACIAFAQETGYREITLWTNDVLTAARKVYIAAGFTLAEEAPHRSFGHDLVGQTWTLTL